MKVGVLRHLRIGFREDFCTGGPVVGKCVGLDDGVRLSTCGEKWRFCWNSFGNPGGGMSHNAVNMWTKLEGDMSRTRG